jgi:hypothetical protein
VTLRRTPRAARRVTLRQANPFSAAQLYSALSTSFRAFLEIKSAAPRDAADAQLARA